MIEHDAVIAQRDAQLARLLEAHKALVHRFEQADAERRAQAAELADATLLVALAEQEIALRATHAQGLGQALEQQRLDAEETRQHAEARIDQAVESAIAGADKQVTDLRNALAEREQRLADLHRQLEQSHRDLAQAHEKIQQVTDSRSWKLTRPLRALSALLGRRQP